MSLYDYETSRRLPSDTPFYALIMAAMRRADTTNLGLLREAWPGIYAELEARYNAPGGVLPGDPEYGRVQEARQEWESGLAHLRDAMSRSTEHPH